MTTYRRRLELARANTEVLTLEVSNNSWTNFIGMFEGDDEFAELASELHTERELDMNDAV